MVQKSVRRITDEILGMKGLSNEMIMQWNAYSEAKPLNCIEEVFNIFYFCYIISTDKADI